MKRKLIRTIDGYELFTQGFLKGSTNHGLIESLNIEEGPIRYKLSLKNCQAIESGYDLDELAKKEIVDGRLHPNDGAKKEGIARGFELALEILGDKKFSEEQLREAFFHVQNEPTFDVFKQSLQQTQWDVEVVMVPAMSNNGNVYYGDIPKLDAGGCLTLKRI
jgi:hypothetical protein